MSIDLGRRIAKLNYGDPFTAYTGITITSPDSEDKFTSGNDSGRILEVEIPWASQKMADNLLAQFSGMQHQPFTATGAILDPAAEIGDAVTVDGVSGIMYRRDQRFGSLYRADISSPGDEEINHEIPYYPPIQRAVKRIGDVARGAAAGIKVMQETVEGLRIDTKECIASIGDVRSGLYAIATADDIEGLKEAKTTLFATISDDISTVSADLVLISNRTEELESSSAALSARVDGAEASLILTAEKVEDHAWAIATLDADVVELKGRVNLTDTAYVTEGHGLGVKGSIVANGNILGNGYIGTADANGYVLIGAQSFKPTEITSTSGTVLVLGIT